MCAVTRGDRPLSITWSLKGDIISSDPVLTTTMIGQQTSLLIIAAVDYQHSGTYTCRVENAAGMSTHSAELTVNGIFTGRTEILYLQRSLRLFLLTLVESLWMKESLWWLSTILEEETGPTLSPGISRGTSSIQTLIWLACHFDRGLQDCLWYYVICCLQGLHSKTICRSDEHHQFVL